MSSDPSAPPMPMRVRLTITSRQGTVAEFFVVPVAGEPRGPGHDHSQVVDNPADSARQLVETIGREIARSRPTADWILLGEPDALCANEDLGALTATGYRLTTAVADRDGAVALLAGPESRVSQVFVAPNLSPAMGRLDHLTVTRDRQLPQSVTALHRPHPIAVRLSLSPAPIPPPAPLHPHPLPHLPPVSPAAPQPSPVPPAAPAETSPPATDADFERRMKDMLMPLITKILSEIRPGSGG